MPVYNLETTFPPETKTKNILKELDGITDSFTGSLVNQINKLLLHHITSNSTKTWDDALAGLDSKKLKPLIYNHISQLWQSSWSVGSLHGRKDILSIYKKNKVKRFNEQLNLATFATQNNDGLIGRLSKQIENAIKGQQEVGKKQEDLDSSISKLQQGINNPTKYAKNNINRDRSFSPEEQETIRNTLSNRLTELNAEKLALNKQSKALKQQEEFARYQLTKAANNQPLTNTQQPTVLSQEEIQQLRRDKKQRQLLQKNERQSTKELERQQQLLIPLESNKSLASQVTKDIRNRRILESQRNRDVSNQLKVPISLKDETEFGKYLDKRYEYIAKKLSDDVSESTKQNIQSLIGNTKNKIATYLSSTEQKRERNLLQALSPLYPDYGAEARKIIKEKKDSLLTKKEIQAQQEIINNTFNPREKRALQEKLDRDLSQGITLSQDQARRLGLTSNKISQRDLEQLSKKKSVLPRIKRTALTELSAAYNYGRFAHYEADGIELVRWVVSVEHLRMERQTKKPYSGQGVVCEMCVGMADRDTGYGQGVYDTLLFRTDRMIPPPIHPNCNCYLEPVEGKRNKGLLSGGQLASAAILGGVALASIGLLNRMFNRTRPSVARAALNDLLEDVPRSVLQELTVPTQNLYNVLTVKHKENLNIQLQAPSPTSQPIRLSNEEDILTANRVIEDLEKPIVNAKSKYSIGQTIKGRNNRVLTEGQRALGNDIQTINKAQQLIRESENKRALFKERFQAAEGNVQLQNQLLNQYSKYISDLNKTINSLDISQIKLVNAYNSANNALEETKQTMQRYRAVDALSPGLVNADDLVNNTNSVKVLNNQSNRLYNNINNTQQQRNEFRDTLLNTKNSLINDTSMSQLYLQNKSKELNYLNEILTDNLGRSTLETNLSIAEEYINVVRQRVVNQAATNPRDYTKSLADLENAVEQLNLVRSSTDSFNLDMELLDRAANNPTANINGVSSNPNQQIAQVVKAKLDRLSQLEVESNNLQVQLKQLKENSPKAKDQISINPRQLNKEVLLNNITRQMGSLAYEQQSLNPTNPRYNEISNLINELNVQKNQIDNAYFKRVLNTELIQIKQPKKRITVNGR